LKPVENQHGNLEQEAIEAAEIFWLCSPLKGALRQAAEMWNMAPGDGKILAPRWFKNFFLTAINRLFKAF
jgi:hypothetical protein